MSTETHNPIKNHVGGIFVHVTDMQRSIQWYSDLLGMENAGTDYHNGIYEFPMQRQQGTTLLLDSNINFTKIDGRHPQFMLATDDIQEAYRYLQAKEARFIGDIEYAGPVSFFVVEDPDGNLVMVCQNHEGLEA